MPPSKKTAKKVAANRSKEQKEEPVSVAIPQEDMERLTRLAIILRFGQPKQKTLLIPFAEIDYTEATAGLIILRQQNKLEFTIETANSALITEIIDNFRFDKQDQLRDIPPRCRIRGYQISIDEEGTIEREEI